MVRLNPRSPSHISDFHLAGAGINTAKSVARPSTLVPPLTCLGSGNLQTGLTAASLSSPHTLASIDAILLDYIQSYIPRPGSALLAGNSVHADKAFMVRRPFCIRSRGSR